MNMQVVILAAGRGSRLGTLTDDLPKCFMKLGGETLINRHMEALQLAGLNDITIVTGYSAEHLEALGRKTAHNPDWENTNMVSSLLCAESVLSSESDMIVGYGDIVFEPRVIKALLSAPGDIVTVIDLDWLDLWSLRSGEPLEDAETLRMSESGLISEIGGKPDGLEEIDGQYIGLTKFTHAGKKILRDFLDQAGNPDWPLSKSLQNMYFTDLLQGLINAGHKVQSAKINSGWLEVDTPEDLAVYEQGLREQTIKRFYNPSVLKTGSI